MTKEAELSGRLLLRRVGEETLIHDPAARRLCFLNATASRVWEMESAGKSTEEIVAALRETYPEPSEGQVRKDVEQCQAELQRLSLAGRAPRDTREDTVDEAQETA